MGELLSGLVSRATAWFAAWKIVLIVGAVCLAVGAGGALYVKAKFDAAARVHVVTQTLHTQWKLDQKSYDAGLAAGKARVVIQTQTKTLIQKVPVYVTAQNDAECVVPVGFVRLYNAAVTESDLAPSVRADGAPSGVAISTVAATDIANIGTYNEVADQLRRLQKWESDRVAAERAAQK